ncbi:MAG: hypothetical protein K0S34_2522 [Bacillales bacterium]|jgi:uncharacterized membrane-anchored protein YitT (DUF2179 family)|nr:hypothetical protein [Bacillales bacterium]
MVQHRGIKIFSNIMEYLYVLIGSTIIAVSFNVFLRPNEIASGGISGLSIITEAVFNWDPAFVQWSINIPLFFVGTLLLGKQFGVKTFIGTIFLPLVIFLTKDLDAATNEPLLGALFGGIGVGLGLGVVFRGRASTGGTDLIAQILHKYTPISLGVCVALIDGLIVISAATVFTIEQGLYALIGLFVTSKTIDLVQVGVPHSKMALIITTKEKEVSDGILQEIDRGLTKLSGFGGYTSEKKLILMTVVETSELVQLKQLVKEHDPNAFIILMDATEVVGQGFKI